MSSCLLEGLEGTVDLESLTKRHRTLSRDLVVLETVIRGFDRVVRVSAAVDT